MKSRIAVFVLLVVVSIAAVKPLRSQETPDPRLEKRALVIEVLKTIDTKHLTQSTIELLSSRMLEGSVTPEMKARMTTEHRKEFEAEMAKQGAQIRAMLDRLFARIDYAKYDAEVFIPMFEREFTTDELRELLAFYKTKVGRTAARVMPALSVDAFVHSMKLIQEDARFVQNEMQMEADAKRPSWDRTMADMRTIATATEAYMTDENKVPDVHDIRDLAKALEPIYVRTLPQTDGWGEPYVFVVSSDRAHYRIVSKGADKHLEFGSDTLAVVDANTPPRKSSSLDDDIIYQDGTFIQYPALFDEKSSNR